MRGTMVLTSGLRNCAGLLTLVALGICTGCGVPRVGPWADMSCPKVGILDFRLAPYGIMPASCGLTVSVEDRDRFVASLENDGPAAIKAMTDKYLWLPLTETLTYPVLITAQREGTTYLLVSDELGHVLLSPASGGPEWGLKRAFADVDQWGRPAVGVEFDDAGAEQFARLTENNVENHLAIIIDGKVMSAPLVMSRIRDRALITGEFTNKRVKEMIASLRHGMPPAASQRRR